MQACNRALQPADLSIKQHQPMFIHKLVGLIVCGTNIGAERYAGHLARGTELLDRRPG